MATSGTLLAASDKTSFKTSDIALAYLLLRVTLGVNMLMHGVARLIAGEDKFVASVVEKFHASPLPHPLVYGFAAALPWIEAAIGLLVLLGLRTRLALTAGGLLIVVLMFGVTLVQNWETAGQQLVYAVVFALLLAFAAVDRYSVDAWMGRGK